MNDTYHHGSLREAVLERAVEVIERDGVQALSLRSLAADLGVSHTAPRHHFGSREGVLRAVATQGFQLLAERLIRVRESGEGFVESGVIYVEFAIEHPAHFQVMFTPGPLGDDPELHAARASTFAELRTGVDRLPVGPVEDAAAAVLAAWALVHGIATLALTGNLEAAKLRPLIAGGDLSAITRRAAGMLYQSPERSEA
ncbi:MAG: TetR/AcrR family transcriptional regulator [Microlunatus sp.]|nr:TetR/AcrR family transcriptional regulator [Microlunatus sp.]